MNETANTNSFDIEALPITITYMGETTKDDRWVCDQWRVVFSNERSTWTTCYYTGLGLRGEPLLRVQDGGPPPQRGTLMWERIEKSRPPVTPKKADVLCALCLDAQAADSNFNDWCINFGYDNDSIKALNTYKQCCDTATQLRHHFTPEQRKAITEIVDMM